MKKLGCVTIGIFIGIIMSFTVSVYGGSLYSLIGSEVGDEWSLSVDGEKVGVVPILSGRSYAPVRQIAELAGFEVDFEKGAVYLESKNINQEKNVIDNTVKGDDDLETQLYMVKSKINSLLAEEHGEKVAIDPGVSVNQERRDYAIKRLPEIQAELLELEKKKTEIELKIKESAN